MHNDPLDYIAYYGLKEAPFRLSPDPSYFFPSEPHIEIKKVLLFAITRGEGFIVLTGEAGTGKSLLLNMILKELPPNKETAVIVAPKVSPPGLLKLILADLGVDPGDTQETAFLQKKFEELMLCLAQKGKELIIVIDEAQNLSLETLEQLRLLSNIETHKKKLLQILLIGQPELVSLITSPSLGQLAQRVTVNETLRPLNEKEVRDYVHYRLHKSGGGGIRVTNRAIKALHKASDGIPRLVNKVMDRALLVAASKGDRQISKGTIEEALATLPKVVTPRPKIWFRESRRVLLVYGLIVAFILVVPATYYYFSQVSRYLKEIEAGPQSLPPVKTSLTQVGGQGTGREKRPRFAVVRIKRAFVRQGPGVHFPRFTTVSMGNRLKVQGERGRWIKIRVFDARGEMRDGWIRKDLVIFEN